MGLKEHSFSTIQNFHRVLDSCEASNYQGNRIKLFEAMEQAIALFSHARNESGKVILIGNGGSAAIASHVAIDLWNKGRLRAQCFNDAELLTCMANDHGYEEVFARPVAQFMDKKDVLIAISSSGESRNILKASEEAQKIGCELVTFSAFSAHNPLRKKGGLNFYLNTESYGIAEVGHMLLLHAMVDEFIEHKARLRKNFGGTHIS